MILAVILLGTATLDAESQVATDSTAIMQAVERWERAWTMQDPVLAARDYAADADWTNAFGMRRIGRASIEVLLKEVFSLPFVMAGDTEHQYHDLRFLGEGVATVRSLALREGQQLPDGTVEPTRRTNHLRVFANRGNGWVIVSHLIGDERTPGQPR